MSKKRIFDCEDAEVKANAEAAWLRLSPKRRVFCEQYIIKCNAADAARQAGYSAKTANKIGSALLTKVDIADVIAGLQGERSRVAVLSFEDRAAILSQIATASLASLLKYDTTDTLDAEGVHAAGAALGSISHSSSSSSGPQGNSEAERWSVKTRCPITAIHELNLMFGDHAPKRLHIEDDNPDDIDRYTDAQIEAMIAAEVDE